jgi:DNA gyrase/topoisomerase IV subunit B
MRESEIEVLTDREHVLLRPQIYIGDTTTTEINTWTIDRKTKKFTIDLVPFNEGFFKLYSEIIDNSIDEYIKTNGQFGNIIKISILDRNHIIVEDNGRGVPTSKHKQFKDKTQFEIAFTYLKAGSNFRKGTEQTESDTNIGMNGVGVSLVNILSNSFKVITEDKNERYVLNCSDHMKNIECSKIRKTHKTGTTVDAEIDMSCFENSELITKENVKLWCYKRLVELHTFYPEIKFYFNDEQISKTIYDMIDYRNCTAKDNKGNSITIVFKNSPAESDMSYVNSLNTYNEGTHLKYAQDSVFGLIGKKIKKKFGADFKDVDIRKYLYIIFSVNNLPNPKFSTQNKTKLITKRSIVEEYVNDSIFDKCVNLLFSNYEEDLKNVVDKLENKIVEKAQKKEKLNIAKHIECNTKNRKDAILFITEGLSASGMFRKVRNHHIHACYPLRGKILNVYNESAKNVVASEELKNLMNIIGLKIGVKPDPKVLNYSNISMVCDADQDGRDIESLLIIFFYKFFPELFKMNMIYKVYAPFIVITKGNKKKIYYTLEDYNKDMDKIVKEGWKTSYYKGLGKMNEDEYREMLNNPVCSVITLDDAEKINKTMETLFGKNTDIRKKWLQGDYKID